MRVSVHVVQHVARRTEVAIAIVLVAMLAFFFLALAPVVPATRCATLPPGFYVGCIPLHVHVPVLDFIRHGSGPYG